MSNSLTVELIPWNTNNLEKKTYNWTISVIDETQMEFQFLFDHPEFISMADSADVMTITFDNTAFYLAPENPNASVIPNGFSISVNLPPQGEKAIVKTAV